jgi:hypothetical protein
MSERAGVVATAALLLCCVAAFPGAVGAAGVKTPTEELQIFKAWLDRVHPGYGCDEGPARFRNETVEAVYADRRFYYVLTYTRGIPPPFPNGVSLVAHVDESGEVRPLNPSSPESCRPGLTKVRRAEEARRTAAAVLILAMGDPGERRWTIRADQIAARKSRKGWVCTYHHGDENHASRVTFDRDGVLTAIACNPPPVP